MKNNIDYSLDIACAVLIGVIAVALLCYNFYLVGYIRAEARCALQTVTRTSELLTNRLK